MSLPYASVIPLSVEDRKVGGCTLSSDVCVPSGWSNALSFSCCVVDCGAETLQLWHLKQCSHVTAVHCLWREAKLRGFPVGLSPTHRLGHTVAAYSLLGVFCDHTVLEGDSMY